MYKKGGPLNLLTWLKGGGVPKNMGAISGGLEKIWNKKQFLLHPAPRPPSNLNYDWSLIIEWAFPFFNQHDSILHYSGRRLLFCTLHK